MKKRRFAQPIVLNSDTIAGMEEPEIKNRLENLNAELTEIGDSERGKPWEVELCYLERELQMRKLRSQLHTQYLKKIQEEEPEEDWA